MEYANDWGIFSQCIHVLKLSSEHIQFVSWLKLKIVAKTEKVSHDWVLPGMIFILTLYNLYIVYFSVMYQFHFCFGQGSSSHGKGVTCLVTLDEVTSVVSGPQHWGFLIWRVSFYLKVDILHDGYLWSVTVFICMLLKTGTVASTIK